MKKVISYLIIFAMTIAMPLQSSIVVSADDSTFYTAASSSQASANVPAQTMTAVFDDNLDDDDEDDSYDDEDDDWYDDEEDDSYDEDDDWYDDDDEDDWYDDDENDFSDITVSAGNLKYSVSADAGNTMSAKLISYEKVTASVQIPDTISVDGKKYKVTSIGSSVFSGNSTIKSVKIGDNVTEIGSNAFSKCKNLKSVVIGKKVTSIGKQAFYNSKALAKVTIKSVKLKNVGKAAFFGVKAKVKICITPESGKVIDVQEALDTAHRDGENSYVIKVPKGTYKMTSGRGLAVYSNTTLDLRGVTYKGEKFIHNMITIGNSFAKGYNGGHDITILGGVFHAGTSTMAAPDLCLFSHVSNVTIDGTTFKYLPKKKLPAGQRNTHMIEFAGSKNVTIKNCKFYENSNCYENNEAVQIESLQNEKKLVATTPANLGKRDGTQCKNVTIRSCYFSGFRYGCGSNHLSKKDHYTNMKFLKNTFVGAKKYAICLFGYRKVTISGNKLKNSGSLYQNQNSTGVQVK